MKLRKHLQKPQKSHNKLSKSKLSRPPLRKQKPQQLKQKPIRQPLKPPRKLQRRMQRLSKKPRIR